MYLYSHLGQIKAVHSLKHYGQATYITFSLIGRFSGPPFIFFGGHQFQQLQNAAVQPVADSSSIN
jgi:hypothetical protein